MCTEFFISAPSRSEYAASEWRPGRVGCSRIEGSPGLEEHRLLFGLQIDVALAALASGGLPVFAAVADEDWLVRDVRLIWTFSRLSFVRPVTPNSSGAPVWIGS
jgi:hypothetical protein